MTGRIFIYSFACLLFLSSSQVAQTSSADPSRKLLLNVAVTTDSGRWVGGLKTDNFLIKDKGAPHRIISSSLPEAPASVGILIDTSGSSLQSMADIQKAAIAFVKGCKNRNEYFMMTFNAGQYPLLEATDDMERVLQALDKLSAAKPKENTAVYDAIDVALDKLAQGKHEKKVLIVISDGQDNVSKLSFGRLREKVRLSDSLIYHLNPTTKQDWVASALAYQALWYMEDLVKISGGRVLTLEKGGELADLARRTAQEIDNLYRIELETSGPSAKQKPEWRKLGIKVVVGEREKDLGKISVRTREGYYSSVASKQQK